MLTAVEFCSWFPCVSTSPYLLDVCVNLLWSTIAAVSSSSYPLLDRPALVSFLFHLALVFWLKHATNVLKLIHFLNMTKGYGIVNWRFINLINLQGEKLFHSANKSIDWYQSYHKLYKFMRNIEMLIFQYSIEREYWNVDISIFNLSEWIHSSCLCALIRPSVPAASSSDSPCSLAHLLCPGFLVLPLPSTGNCLALLSVLPCCSCFAVFCYLPNLFLLLYFQAFVSSLLLVALYICRMSVIPGCIWMLS